MSAWDAVAVSELLSVRDADAVEDKVATALGVPLKLNVAPCDEDGVFVASCEGLLLRVTPPVKLADWVAEVVIDWLRDGLFVELEDSDDDCEKVVVFVAVLV